MKSIYPSLPGKRHVFIPGGPSEPPGPPQAAQGRQIVHAAYSLEPELLASTVVMLSQWPCFRVGFPTLPLIPPSLSL